PFLRYAASGEINTEVADPSATVQRMTKKLESDGVTIDLLDGLTAFYDDWWFNLRPSNTEPLLRLNLEANDDASCRRHVDEVLAQLKEIG
ncbi:MAG TPA: phosphomannomutase/phosphoglucomutase, partial [Acidimicrobiales bacterium]|nr:phosphomannomutase/phosphoglucomutase [Acidimicrobiales bacterium]